MHSNLKIIITLIVFMFCIFCFSQTGSIKIFSEIENIEIYLDDVLQGSNIKNIDSVSEGSHYLKVFKNGVIIYGELIKVESNLTSTILIKKSEEMRKKYFAGKSEEMKKYKEEKLNILITAIDWHISQGEEFISEEVFAELTNNNELKDKINEKNEKNNNAYKSWKRMSNIKGSIGLTTCLSSLIVTGVVFTDLLFPFLPQDIRNISPITGTAGIVMGIASYVLLSSIPADYVHETANCLSLEEAKKGVNEYNEALKKSLNLEF